MSLQVLDNKKIDQKILRLAYEIYENNHDEIELFFIGVNNNGLAFATLLETQLKKISPIKIHLHQVQINPANPIDHTITIDIDSMPSFKEKVLILVDDVANTGRTLFYCFKPMMEILPKKIELAVLVDRKHKNFPVKVDYVGLSLATTLQENIKVVLAKNDKKVFLR